MAGAAAAGDYDAALKDAKDLIFEQALRIRKLENENASLHKQLEMQLSRSRVPASEGGEQAVSPLSGDHTERYEALARRYAELEAKHNTVSTAHETCEPRIQEMKTKLKAAKKSVNAWKDYAERDKRSRSTKPGRPDTPAISEEAAIDHAARNLDSDKTPTQLPGARAHEVKTRMAGPQATPTTSSAFPSSPPPHSDQIHSRPPSRTGVPRVTSSQTTVDDTQPRTVPAPPKPAPSSDSEPVFVSARSLKRKRDNSTPAEQPIQRIKQEPNSPDTAIQLESDEYSSPQRTSDRTFGPQISDLDLDAVGSHMVTPRRPPRVSELRHRASSEEVSRPPPNLIRSVSSYSEGNTRELDNASTLAKTEPGQGSSREQGLSVFATSNYGLTANDGRHNAVLRPISVNVPTVSRTGNAQTKTKSRLRRTGAKDKVRLLSEDGDDGFSQPSSHQPQQPGEAATDHRLEDMLNESMHERTPSLPRRAIAAKPAAQKERQSPHLPTPASLIKRPSPKKPWRSPMKRPRGLEGSPPPLGPEHEPLRDKPLVNLRMEDFKINPKYLGTTYAFADTLRGRDARRNLHTCTRADCCGGALQKAIAMGGSGSAMSGKTDAEALETFLGSDWANHLGGYSREKRDEILKQAHVHCFANQHGKHKSAFERRSTPPGFWDTDFPTTQQVAENRAIAKEMEKKQIEERWREAMREGGRFLFRDE